MSHIVVANIKTAATAGTHQTAGTSQFIDWIMQRILMQMEETSENGIEFRGPHGCLFVQWESERLGTDDGFPMSSHLVSLDVGFMQASKQVYMQDRWFADFLKSLIPLHEKLDGKVEHESMEGDLSIQVEYFPAGQVIVSGELTDYYADSTAQFTIETDQSYMNKVILEAKKLLTLEQAENT